MNKNNNDIDIETIDNNVESTEDKGNVSDNNIDGNNDKNDITENLENDENNLDEVDKVDEVESKYNEILDKYQRLMAEFDNYRKRNEKEKSDMYDYGMTNAISKILPIIDNFERGIANIPEEMKNEAINNGFIKIYDQFISTLDSMNVKPIDALDKEFDPNFHNAVMHDEDDTKGENIIVEELQKGYTYKDKVIRYSMVKVVN